MSCCVACAKGRVAASLSGLVGRLQLLLVATDGGAGRAVDKNGRDKWFAVVWVAAFTGVTCGDLCWQRERVAAAPFQHA